MAGTRRAKGEGSVHITRNNGYTRYVASFTYYSEDGKRRFVRGYGTTAAEAVAARQRNWQAKMLTGTNGNARVSKSPTIAEYVDIWLNDPENTAQSTTKNKYRADCRNHIVPNIGKIEIKKLTRDDVKKLFFETLPKKGVGTSAVKHSFTVLNTMLNHAYKNEVIPHNVMVSLKKPEHINTTAINDERWMSRWVSLSKGLIKWIAEPDNKYHEHYPRILFMYLGLRRAELLGMKWSEITNLETKNKCKLRISTQLIYEAELGYYFKERTKSGKHRTILLPEEWRLALLEEKRRGRKPASSEYEDVVFLQKNGKPYSYNNNYRIWNDILDAYYHLEPNRDHDHVKESTYYFRPHALRHIVASQMAADNINESTLIGMLGHGSIDMSRHYQHATDLSNQQAAESISGAFGTKQKP